jgi:nitric oxide reductase activation protein
MVFICDSSIAVSDGEPAAFGYEQNGIVDTSEAVIEARKKGIEVIGQLIDIRNKNTVLSVHILNGFHL